MQLSATEVRVLSRLIERALALPFEQREAFLADLPGPQQALVPRVRERLAQLATRGPDTEVAVPAAVAVPPPLPRVPRPEPRVGPYRLLAPLGDGGEHARVWRAERAVNAERQVVVLRLTAVAPAVSEAPALPVLIAERQVVLLPAHPHIVRLIDAGIDTQGRFYRVLPYVEGLGLVAHAQRRGLGVHAVVALFTAACRLVAHVHAGEVACTALGPDSFRIDEDGHVRLLDWGCGRSLRPDTGATDIRALGGLLQALLAGAGAGGGPGPDVAHVLRRALPPAGLHSDVETYATVAALVDDLQLVLSWQPVPGADADALHRTGLWLRRHRVRLALGGVGAALLLALAWAGAQSWQRGQGQAQRADAVRLFLQEQLPEALLDAAPEGPAAAAGPASAADLAVEAPRVQLALEKARMGFAGEPVLRGQVITALGVRFRVLGQPEQALTVLQEAVTLLQGTSRADEPALGVARAELARQHGLLGSAAGRERAIAGAQQVLASCTGGACTVARATAQRVLREAQEVQEGR